MAVSKDSVDLIDASLSLLIERLESSEVLFYMDTSQPNPLCERYKRWRYQFGSQVKGRGQRVYWTCQGCPVLKVTSKHRCLGTIRDESHWLRVWLKEQTIDGESLRFRLMWQRAYLLAVIHWLQGIRQQFIYGKDNESNH